MIPIGELRRNNLLRQGDDIATVRGLPADDFIQYSIESRDNDIIYGEPYESFESIELTEKWLIKFGFEDGKIHLFEDYFLQVAINAFSGTLKTAPKWFVSIIRIASNDRITLVKNYVHELQNLYFALTNKELTIK